MTIDLAAQVLELAQLHAELHERDVELARLRRSCPCTRATPCKSLCSCAHPEASGGCERCCRYGSEEQRQKNAEEIVVTDEHLRRLEAAALKLDEELGYLIRPHVVGNEFKTAIAEARAVRDKERP